MGTLKNRKNPRTQVSLVARYRSPTAFEFVREECFDLSIGGMFIKSDVPAPSGTLLKLDCDVDDGADRIRGVARVVWLREFDSEEQPAGMGVKFVKLEPGARETIQGLLQRMGGDNGASAEARGSVAAPMPQSSPPAAQAPSTRPATRTPSIAPAEAHAAEVPVAAVAARPSMSSTNANPSTAPDAASASEPTTSAAMTNASAVEAPPPPAQVSVEAIVPTRSKRKARNLRERLRQVQSAGAENVSHVHDGTQPRTGPTNVSASVGVAAVGESTHAAAVAPPAQGLTTVTNQPIEHSTDAHQPPAVAAAASESLRPVHTGVSVAAANDTTPAASTSTKAPAASPASAPRGEEPAAPFAWKTPAYAAATVIAAIVFYSSVLRTPSEPAPTVEPSVAESAPVEAPSPPPAPEPAPAAPIEAPAPTPAEVIPEAVAVAEPLPVKAHYVLELLTQPAGARVSALGKTLKAPTSLDLGTLDQAVTLQAVLPGFETLSETVDRNGFTGEAGEFRRRHVMTLTAIPKPAPVPVAVAPARKRTPARSVPSATAPVVEAPPPAKPAAPAPAPVAVPKPAVPAPAPVVALAPPEPAPIAAPATPAPVVEKQTPMQAAIACLSTGDNACVISALEGKAKNARELELLIETYRATGEGAKATKQMQVYLEKFPNEKRANTFRQVLDRQQSPPATP